MKASLSQEIVYLKLWVLKKVLTDFSVVGVNSSYGNLFGSTTFSLMFKSDHAILEVVLLYPVGHSTGEWIRGVPTSVVILTIYFFLARTESSSVCLWYKNAVCLDVAFPFSSLFQSLSLLKALEKSSRVGGSREG